MTQSNNNTKKLLHSVAVLGAVTAAGTVATTAHADATTPASASQATVSQAPSKDQQLANLKASQTQAEQALADQNQAALTSQTAVINQQASTATAQENAAYSSAVASQTVANQQVLANAQAHIKTPAQVAQEASAATSQYQADSTAAAQAHQAALNKLANDHAAQSQAIASQIQANETQAERDHDAQVAQATQTVDSKINAAANAVNTAQTNVNVDQNAVNDAQKANDSAQSALTSAQTALKNAQASQATTAAADYVPPVTVSGDPAGADFRVHVPKDVWTNHLKRDNRHLIITKDGQISPAQWQELNVWAARFLNEIRAKVGTKPVKVSQESIAAAQDAMRQYIQKDVPGFSHNEAIYSNVDNKYHLPNFKSSIASGDAFDYLSDENPQETTTMGDMKDSIIGLLTEFIDDDLNAMPGYGHRNQMLGLPDHKYGYDWSGEDNPYFALGGAAPDKSNWWGSASHVFVSTDGFNQHDIPLTSSTTAGPDLNALQAAVTTAQSHVDTADKALNDAKAKLTNDQAVLTKSQAILTSLKSSRDNDITKLAGTVAESPVVKNLKAKLAKVNSDYQSAVKQEHNRYAANTSKTKTDFNAKLKSIKAQPTSVDQLKNQLQGKLDALKKDHKAKLATITKHADDQINALKVSLAAKLSALKDKDVKAYQALHDQLFPAQPSNPSAGDAAKSHSDHYTNGNGQDVTLPSENYQGNDDTAELSKGDVSVSYPVYLTREQVKHNAQALPQTGDEGSLAVVALGAMSAMLGFGLAKKRED